ncbi:hypothetical protein B9Z65_8229 [Elsinoe australis]|uniref:Uncharacterized protein n=1 Tax=Elsinoe australis TaxID=40998 RepID=A0A2P7ZMJ8_9PEZI|nr:hypothetical protein B9Z65_8229 [Elsinoe australis]
MKFSSSVLITILSVITASSLAMPFEALAQPNLEIRQFGCDHAKCMDCYRGCANPNFCFQCQTSP